jgi:malate synthase
VSEQGLRTNVSVGVQYLESWLRGAGAVAISNLMEDAATAEISRAQLWQWCRHRVALDGGQVVTRELVARIVDEELARLRDILGPERFDAGRYDDARRVFQRVALGDRFTEFLTVPAYDLID